MDPGLMNFVQGVEHFFTSGQGDRTFEAWFTHFAVEIVMEQSPSLLLERTEDGVLLYERELAHDMEHMTWEGPPAYHCTLSNVFDFFKTEGMKPDDFATKNCKHLVYDFLAQVIHRRHIGDFFAFCQEHEAVWRREAS